MAKGPGGEKRTAETIGNAVKTAWIATGEEADAPEDDGKGRAAQLERKGGKARADSMSPGRRAEIAWKVAAKRWSD